MYSKFGQYLYDLIRDGDVSLVNVALSMSHFRDHILQMNSEEKYRLVHEILNVMPAGFDDKSEEAKPYVESVVFLMMSIPYETELLDEQQIAIAMSSKIDRTEDLNSKGKMRSLRLFADKLILAMGLSEDVNMGLRHASENTSAEVRKKFNGNAAIYTSLPLGVLRNDFTIECSELHETSILLNGDEILNRSLLDLSQWVAHEMRHHHQRFVVDSNVNDQLRSGISKRINRLMPKTGYFALMEERQAFAFEGWMSDCIQKQDMRSEMQITCDNLWFKGVMSGEFIDRLHDYHTFVNEKEQRKTAKLAVVFL